MPWYLLRNTGWRKQGLICRHAWTTIIITSALFWDFFLSNVLRKIQKIDMSFSALTSLLCTIYLNMYLYIIPITIHEQSQWYLRDYWQMSSFWLPLTVNVFLLGNRIHFYNSLLEKWLKRSILNRYICLGYIYPWDSFSNANTISSCSFWNSGLHNLISFLVMPSS